MDWLNRLNALGGMFFVLGVLGLAVLLFSVAVNIGCDTGMLRCAIPR